MTWFAVQFEDDPGRVQVREAQGPAHREYLERRGERVAVAGSLRAAAGDTPVGGLWLVRAGSELEVREIVEGDPYFAHGLRRTVRIWRFSPAFAGRSVEF